MNKVFDWVLAAITVWGLVFLTSCTKDGDTIYQTDPEDQASTAPLVTVIYDPNALGDRGYNDLIYQGVENAAHKYGLRTMQLSPASVDEGLAYLQLLFEALNTMQDSTRRLVVVAAASYDDFLRKNNSLLESSPNTDLLYNVAAVPGEAKAQTVATLLQRRWDFYANILNNIKESGKLNWGEQYWIDKKVTYLAFTDQYAINLSNGQLSGWDFQWHNPSKHFILAIDYLNY